MQRLVLILLALIGIAVWCGVLVVSSDNTHADQRLPTLMILPSLTASFTPTLTHTPTATLTYRWRQPRLNLRSLPHCP